MGVRGDYGNSLGWRDSFGIAPYLCYCKPRHSERPPQ